MLSISPFYTYLLTLSIVPPSSNGSPNMPKHLYTLRIPKRARLTKFWHAGRKKGHNKLYYQKNKKQILKERKRAYKNDPHRTNTPTVKMLNRYRNR